MMRKCGKCGHENPQATDAPEAECPRCGAIYAKVEARQRHRTGRAEAENRRQIMNKSVCIDCGHLGDPVTKTRGSILIEIALWLCLIIPGLIYTLWRLTSRYKVCPGCKRESMIPASAPRSRKLLAELGHLAPE